MPSQSAPGRLTRPQVWLAVILASVVALNTFAFVKIDDLTSTQRHKALSRADTSELMDLADSSTHSRTRFDLYVTMGELRPGATLVLSDASFERREVYLPFFLSVGDAAEVVAAADYDDGGLPAFADDAAASDFALANGTTLASGDGGSGGPPWRIVEPESSSGDPESAHTFMVLERPIPAGQSFDYEVLVVDVAVFATSLVVKP